MIDFTSFFITSILLTTLYMHLENRNKELTYVKSTIDGRKYLVRNPLTNVRSLFSLPVRET